MEQLSGLLCAADCGGLRLFFYISVLQALNLVVKSADFRACCIVRSNSGRLSLELSLTLLVVADVALDEAVQAKKDKF